MAQEGLMDVHEGRAGRQADAWEQQEHGAYGQQETRCDSERCRPINSGAHWIDPAEAGYAIDAPRPCSPLPGLLPKLLYCIECLRVSLVALVPVQPLRNILVRRTVIAQSKQPLCGNVHPIHIRSEMLPHGMTRFLASAAETPSRRSLQ